MEDQNIIKDYATFNHIRTIYTRIINTKIEKIKESQGNFLPYEIDVVRNLFELAFLYYLKEHFECKWLSFYAEQVETKTRALKHPFVEPGKYHETVRKMKEKFPELRRESYIKLEQIIKEAIGSAICETQIHAIKNVKGM